MNDIQIARSKVQIETGRRTSFIQSEIGVLYEKDHIEINQFTKFEVLSLDYNHIEGFQNSEKLETLCGFGGPLELVGHSLVTTQQNITKLGNLLIFTWSFR